MQPLVSILIPVYNTEEYLPKCLDSIVNQTYSNLQVVIIDDGSKDASLSIAQKYAKQHPYIEVYHQENQGVASTRNNLLDKVKGDYVLFIDSDDWCELDMVEYLVNNATINNTDLIVCGMVVNDALIRMDFQERMLSQEECIKIFLFHQEITGSLCNKFIKKSLLHNLYFQYDISYGEDALFCWSFLQKAKQIMMTNRQLYHYRMNNFSISHKTFGIQKYSAYNVWTNIAQDTLNKWPQFYEFALGHFAVSMTILLRDAAHGSYKKDSKICNMQRVVKKYGFLIRKHKLASVKIWLYSIIAGRFYFILKYLP